VFEERVAIGTVGKRNVEALCVFERLLHAGADGVIVVFRFDDGNRDARLVKKKVVGLLGFTALDRLAAWTDHRGSDELRADVRFCESLLVHGSGKSAWQQVQFIRHGRW
jgi:hypothetical protein